MPKVSVILTTYGTPIFLEKAIQSVLNQTFHDWELIIVDDNNPDSDARYRTEQIILSFSSTNRIKYIKHHKNLNGAAARNTGLKNAEGIYISFLDSDDEYMPERLEQCCAVMDKTDKKIAGVYTGCVFYRGGKIYHIEDKILSGNFLVETLACTFMFCSGSNLFVRKDICEELHGFDVSFLRHQDYEFLVRLFEKYNLESIQKALLKKNNENINCPNTNKMISIKKQYLKKYAQIIDSLTSQQKSFIIHSHKIQIAESAIREKHFKLAVDYYREAFRCSPLSIREISRMFLLFGKSIFQ